MAHEVYTGFALTQRILSHLPETMATLQEKKDGSLNLNATLKPTPFMI